MRGLIVQAGAIRQSSDITEVERAYQDGATIWLDLDQQNEVVERVLAKTLGLHPLVIEDVWSDRAHPKIDRFDDYLYVLVHGVRVGSSATDLDLLEVDIVIGKRFVVTHHEACVAVTAAFDEAARSPKMLERGTAFALHAVLDELVDQYFPVLNELDESLGSLEDQVIELAGRPGTNELLARILEFRRTVQLLRRNGLHQRELFLHLSRDEFPQIPREAVPFFRDVYDHFARVIDLTDDYREILTSALEALFSVQSNRMNEIMKTLTLMSTVMLPLTFIAGVYGMNFERMPELKWVYGYPFALGLMLTVAIVILIWFRRKRWL